MSWPAKNLPMVSQGHTDTVLHTKLSACVEMDAHNLPVMIKVGEIIGTHKNNDRNDLIVTKIMKCLQNNSK